MFVGMTNTPTNGGFQSLGEVLRRVAARLVATQIDREAAGARDAQPAAGGADRENTPAGRPRDGERSGALALGRASERARQGGRWGEEIPALVLPFGKSVHSSRSSASSVA